MTAPALPRPDLQAEAARADAAYTQAIHDARESGNWYMVPVAGHAAQQARAALTTGDQT